ncbi:MAG: NTP transferase domain-containing protein [Myxococcales bacterium]|nr:NTP transferase domain-containing protein [Myxococcales bacterium]
MVLAAGMGTRLVETFDGPKPLVPVAGVPIIVRTLRALALGGDVREACVVTGFRGDEVRAGVESAAAALPLAIRFAQNDRWEEPNGLSLGAARELVGGESFYLSMADHLFDPRIVGMLAQSPHHDSVRLAIDEKVASVFDFDDATKVRCDSSHRITAIGKHIVPCDAVDTGVFLCTAEVFDALDVSVERGERSLSGAMQVLSERGKLRGVPIGDCLWQDIDTPEMYRVAQELAVKLDEVL